MTQPPHLTLVKPKTVLTPHRLVWARRLWSAGYGTDVIAWELGLPEFAIWNSLSLIRGVSEGRAA